MEETMSIQVYKTKAGEKKYRFQLYLGVDPVTGKPRKTTKQGFKTKKAASLEMSRLKLEAQKGLSQPRQKDYTYRELYEIWNESHALAIKESTQTSVEYLFKCRILPIFGKMKVNRITTVQCQQAINKWAKEYITYREVATYFSMVMKYGINIGLINSNPMERVITPNSQINREVRTGNYFTVEELKQFLIYAEQDCSQMMYTFFRVIAFTGIRKGECLALTWNDIDLKNGELAINRTVYYKNGKHIISEPKTKKSKRTIDIDVRTLEILKDWKKAQQKLFKKLGVDMKLNKGLIFHKMEKGREHEHIHNSVPNKTLNTIINRYDLTPITVHGFRHTHCSLLVEAELDIKEVQERLGHKNVQTTLQIYAHVTKKKKRTSGEKFQQYVNF